MLKTLREVTPADYIRGASEPKVTVVEYSDTECPFCKQFHFTMKKLIEEDSEVAWVYRHFPLDMLHSKARHEAVALECSAEQGGKEMFWKYTDRIYEITKSNDTLDPSELPRVARDLGLDTAKFNECLTSGRYADKIEQDVQNAIATGGSGTPWSVVIGKNGKKYPLSGAMQLPQLKALIEKAKAGK